MVTAIKIRAGVKIKGIHPNRHLRRSQFLRLPRLLLRPRWTTLYAASKRQKNAASILPELPDTFFGWIPALYRITEDQVLASAGLDASPVIQL